MFDFQSTRFLNPCLLEIKLLIQDLWRKKLNGAIYFLVIYKEMEIHPEKI